MKQIFGILEPIYCDFKMLRIYFEVIKYKNESSTDLESGSTIMYRDSYWLHTFPLLVQDPRAPRPYLLSDGHNLYNRVVLVCTARVYIPTSLGRQPIPRYLRGCLAPTIGLEAYKIY